MMSEGTVDVNLEKKTLQRIITALESENNRLQQEVLHLHNENAQLRNLSQRLMQEQEVSALDASHEDNADSLADSSNKDTNLSMSYTTTPVNQSSKDSSPSLSTCYTTSQETLEIQVEELETENEEKSKEIVWLRHQLQDTTAKLNKVVDQANTEIQRLESNVEEVNEQNYHLHTELHHHQARIEDLERQLEERQKVTPKQPPHCRSCCPHRHQHTENKPPKNKPQISQDYRSLEDDLTAKWKICGCRESHCTVCMAEQAAEIGEMCNCLWCNELPMNQYNDDGEESDDGSDTEDARSVIIGKERYKLHHNSRKLFYFFHASISDSSYSRDHCQTCSISALIFAYKYKSNPSSMGHEGVSDELFSQVLESINEARENTSLTCSGGQKSEQLGPENTIMALPHLNLQIIDVIDMDMTQLDNLVPYVFHMECDQILLFYRMHRYKVLSIMTSEDGKRILVFDPQWHYLGKMYAHSRLGAVLFSCLRNVELILEMFHTIEKYCGQFVKTCNLAILGQKTMSNAETT